MTVRDMTVRDMTVRDMTVRDMTVRFERFHRDAFVKRITEFEQRVGVVVGS